jgi:hypothetical protein
MYFSLILVYYLVINLLIQRNSNMNLNMNPLPKIHSYFQPSYFCILIYLFLLIELPSLTESISSPSMTSKPTYPTFLLFQFSILFYVCFLFSFVILLIIIILTIIKIFLYQTTHMFTFRDFTDSPLYLTIMLSNDEIFHSYFNLVH